MYATITKEYHISAAHCLPNHKNPDGTPGQCSRLHGHNYKFEVSLTGVVDPITGFVMDFGILKNLLDRVIGPWDHRFLSHLSEGDLEFIQDMKNDTPGIDMIFTSLGLSEITSIVPLGIPTTAENLGRLIVQQLSGELPATITTIGVTVWETPTSWAYWSTEF